MSVLAPGARTGDGLHLRTPRHQPADPARHGGRRAAGRRRTTAACGPGDARQLAAMCLLITQSTIQSAQIVEPILDADALAVELAHSLNGYLKP